MLIERESSGFLVSRGQKPDQGKPASLKRRRTELFQDCKRSNRRLNPYVHFVKRSAYIPEMVQ